MFVFQGHQKVSEEFADVKSNVVKIVIFVSCNVENIVVSGNVEKIVEKKRVNTAYQDFLLFPEYFQKFIYQGFKKSGLCGVGIIGIRLPDIR